MHARFGIERERNRNLFYKEYKNDFCLFHFHSQIELYFVNEGKMEMLVSGQQKTLSAGDISISLGYDPHAYRTPEASRSSVLIIPAELCDSFIEATKNKRLKNHFITRGENAEKIRAYFGEIKNSAANSIRQLGYVHLILAELLEICEFTESEDRSSQDLYSKILFYIQENSKKPITSADIAKSLGYSQSYVSRYFKSNFGITLSAYLTVVRLKSAAALMSTDKHSITYCAMESGFSSMRTFYRAFVAEFGCTPKEYMKSQK